VGPPARAPANVYQEVNLLNNDFDELAGIFSQNSVQSNRQLNETVGGMQMISANANATSEFDLRCFINTWVEPVLSQIVFLEQYYEDDATLIAVPAKRRSCSRSSGSTRSPTNCSRARSSSPSIVNVGSSDPMQQPDAKFKTTFDIAMPVLSLAIKEGKAELNYEDIFSARSSARPATATAPSASSRSTKRAAAAPVPSKSRP
jgi:hypothetical protein